jgi:hypothetical protein
MEKDGGFYHQSQTLWFIAKLVSIKKIVVLGKKEINQMKGNRAVCIILQGIWLIFF